MFKAIFKIVENKYTYIKNFCFSKVIKTHCKKLVVKKKGKDKSKIRKGMIELEKSDLIKINKGDANQKGIITTIDNKRKTVK